MGDRVARGGEASGSGGDGGASPRPLSFKELLARVAVQPNGGISGDQVATLPLSTLFDLLPSGSAPALYSRREVRLPLPVALLPCRLLEGCPPHKLSPTRRPLLLGWTAGRVSHQPPR